MAAVVAGGVEDGDHTLVEILEPSDGPIDVARYVNFVRDPAAGAIATFEGTTRDTFEGKRVVELRYEGYVPMASRQLRAICGAARETWPVRRVAAAHRLGTVGVGEASVFVAVSAVHRAEAMEACRYVIDEVKASVPIWKKEVYDDGEVWKENKEFVDRRPELGLGMKVKEHDKLNAHITGLPYSMMNNTKERNHNEEEEEDDKRSDLELSEGNNEATVPLLLNPAYTRTKSLVSDELCNFRITLKWCALDHSSTTGKAVSYTVFVFLTLLIPAVTSLSIHFSSSSSFNKFVQVPESILCIISFLTISSLLRRYGLRQLLFLDDLQHDSSYVRHGYTCELDRSFKYLAYILLPSFFVEFAHKIVFFSTVTVPFIPFSGNSALFIATITSWVYRTGVFLLACVLFRLTCELQILRFQGFYKMFEGRGEEAGDIFKEHLRIKRQLFVTSHRYRIFIIACLVTITISQLGALLLVLASKSQISFSNSGDLVVCSAVQLSGFCISLLGAARITHRAQRVVTIASRWHMSMSCPSATKHCTQEQLIFHGDYGDEEPRLVSEPESMDQQQSSASFRSRQALVMYLQHNGGGITLFGFALDRGLLHALFAFEMTLVLWILSKVVVLS
ncbi:hypothetical protein J5N97_026689 [Dioscorea zingiberensis]|uniref:Molybdopterin synthase catalytic subunit n=1 Tax=Dioscorea zingiberensis TaxID=325984 RepID=A0A9D5H6W5_9LILI|nr:hypothetical protein J5N97_026689 [Dioscorea zingiberensis]